MTELKIWTCKIGGITGQPLPYGADWPMRQALAQAYREITGRDAEFCFSGWGGELTESERAVIEAQATPKSAESSAAP